MAINDRRPLISIFAANEVLLYRVRVRMMLRKLDTELAHVPARASCAVNHFAESIMRQ